MVRRESRGERVPGSSCEGDVDCLPSDPARAREMKLFRRSRFLVLGGDGGESFLVTGMIGRSTPLGLVESIDQREAGTARDAAGKSSTGSINEDVEVVREARDGWCAAGLGGMLILIGEAGIVAKSARVRNWGDDTCEASVRFGRGLRLGLPSDEGKGWRFSMLLLRTGG